jgi:hypothetical protein
LKGWVIIIWQGRVSSGAGEYHLLRRVPYHLEEESMIWRVGYHLVGEGIIWNRRVCII